MIPWFKRTKAHKEASLKGLAKASKVRSEKAKERLDEKAKKLLNYKTEPSKAKAQVKKRGYYSKSKGKFKDKIINYPESPTGKAYVGVNKEPFMKVKGGHGFHGMLIQDDERRFCQCHVCGKWMKRNGAKHIAKHGMTVNEYKDEFGLFRGAGLVSDETSLKLTKACLKNKESIGTKGVGARGKAFPRETEGNQRTAFQNKHGSCPEQIKQRTYEFIRCNRELPTKKNRGQSLYKLLRIRFGSYGAGLKAIGLPHFKRIGTNYKYTFPDHTVYKINVNKFHDREILYNMMMEKCPVLKDN